jgi:hypothetical protein
MKVAKRLIITTGIAALLGLLCTTAARAESVWEGSTHSHPASYDIRGHANTATPSTACP